MIWLLGIIFNFLREAPITRRRRYNSNTHQAHHAHDDLYAHAHDQMTTMSFLEEALLAVNRWAKRESF
ncbi:hypothetical protein Hamer_G008637 [Homarus americanus]|uniref:Uncharacterized protein n=1 Tax=Homarus americanus TaxID=6706 RepID=A0A8J5N4E4_HOMAM|nr:hypothetical protein Hamer_G008637 [Homarus americanus]